MALATFRAKAMRIPQWWALFALFIIALACLGTAFDAMTLAWMKQMGVPKWLRIGLPCWAAILLFLYWVPFLMRGPLRKHLRETLVANGIAVCLRCGYDLRSLDDPRCPECGAPFDPALLDAASRTRSVSDGP